MEDQLNITKQIYPTRHEGCSSVVSKQAAKIILTHADKEIHVGKGSIALSVSKQRLDVRRNGQVSPQLADKVKGKCLLVIAMDRTSNAIRSLPYCKFAANPGATIYFLPPQFMKLKVNALSLKTLCYMQTVPLPAETAAP